ncbi:MAG: hypothetical protein ABG776_09630 [Cyanobacteria bacterium J06555_13]
MSVQTRIRPIEEGPRQVAILVENEFEDVEFKISHAALRQAGVTVTV